MFALNTDTLVISAFGSISGLAALVVAINTIQARRDAKQLEKDKREADKDKTATSGRIDLIAASQASLKGALDRADNENKELRLRLDEQIQKTDDQIALARKQAEQYELDRAEWRRNSEEQAEAIRRLKSHVEILERELAALKGKPNG